MLNDVTCFKQVYIVCGYADLRFGIDTLASIVDAKTDNSPYVPDTLYLFCGRKSDRIKGLVWEKDGFLLLYKRLEQGKFVWPRNESEVQAITSQQFRWLMEGLTITSSEVTEGTRGFTLTTGFLGSGNFRYVCKRCGNKWKPGSMLEILQRANNNHWDD